MGRFCLSSRRFGERECNHPDRDRLHEAAIDFINNQAIDYWSEDEMSPVLFALARNNEAEHLVEEIGGRPGIPLAPARAALRFAETDAKWQLAEELGQLGTRTEEVERLLIEMASDADGYVRRRSLRALARLGSSAVEDLASKEWDRPNEHQEYPRMNVLWALHRVGSKNLEDRVVEAEQEDRPYLADYAGRIRRGIVES